MSVFIWNGYQCRASYPDAMFPASVYLLFRNFWTSMAVVYIFEKVQPAKMAYPGCYALFIPSNFANLISYLLSTLILIASYAIMS